MNNNHSYIVRCTTCNGFLRSHYTVDTLGENNERNRKQVAKYIAECLSDNFDVELVNLKDLPPSCNCTNEKDKKKEPRYFLATGTISYVIAEEDKAENLSEIAEQLFDEAVDRTPVSNLHIKTIRHLNDVPPEIRDNVVFSTHKEWATSQSVQQVISQKYRNEIAEQIEELLKSNEQKETGVSTVFLTEIRSALRTLGPAFEYLVICIDTALSQSRGSLSKMNTKHLALIHKALRKNP